MFALVGLTVLAAPFFLVALIIKLESDGPAIRRQKRVGKDGKHFVMYKFRTMTMDAPNKAPTEFDPSKFITRFGSILRVSSFDELPQLVNVLRGEMALIGPRPVLPSEKTTNTLRQKHGVHSLRPGITGWAQVNGRNNLGGADSFEEERFKLDQYYLNHLSLKIDCLSVVRTFTTVIVGDGVYMEHAKTTVPVQKNVKK